MLHCIVHCLLCGGVPRRFVLLPELGNINNSLFRVGIELTTPIYTDAVPLLQDSLKKIFKKILNQKIYDNVWVRGKHILFLLN